MLSENETKTAELETESPPESEQYSRGVLFVVSSPSGGGKGTLINRVLKTVPGLSYSVSYTTRAPRKGEVDGADYFFVSTSQFEELVAADQFLEWARVHGNLYGTSRAQVLKEIGERRDIILEVDVQGAASVRKLLADAVSIFIVPPSFEVLNQRLVARNTDSALELELRLRNAPIELRNYVAFDYVIVNDDLDRASAQLASVIYAERARRKRQEQEVRRVAETFPVT
ncbi:MAG TPA: guanylate kinase [Pyrinomonadaceae bacterium]|nr:guanylate kinase [Pyrinomonadaceae bacterium]